VNTPVSRESSIFHIVSKAFVHKLVWREVGSDFSSRATVVRCFVGQLPKRDGG